MLVSWVRYDGQGREAYIGRIPVPVLLGVTHTLSNRDGLVPPSGESLEHVLRQVHRRLLVDIVGDRQPRIGRRITRIDGVGKVVLCVLDQVRGDIVVVVGVEVEVSDVVSKLFHGGHACRGAARVRRPHVRGNEADDVAHRRLELVHLRPSLLFGQGREVGMRPGVRGQLVPGRLHLFDHGVPGGSGVDRALGIVDARDEEGGFGAVVCEDVEHGVRVDVGAVVVGQGDVAGVHAIVDIGA